MSNCRPYATDTATTARAFLESIPAQWAGKIRPRVFVVTGGDCSHCSLPEFERFGFSARTFHSIVTPADLYIEPATTEGMKS
jgi:hypothetical protein